MSHDQLPERQPEAALTYGDVFNIQGGLAKKPISPRDASLMQALEMVILGGTPRGGVAAHLRAAAARNEMAGVLRPDDTNDTNYVPDLEAMAESPRSTSSESSSSEVPNIFETMDFGLSDEDTESDEDGITIGKDAALTDGKNPAEESGAESQETGPTAVAPGGAADLAAAPSAATRIATAEDEVS